MNTNLRVIVLILLALTSSAAFADAVIPIQSVSPNAITVAADGSIWFAGTAETRLAKVGRVRTDGWVQVVDVAPGSFYVGDIYDLRDGSVLVTWQDGSPVRVRTFMTASIQPRLNALTYLPGEDSSYWAIESTRMTHIDNAGAIVAHEPLPFEAVSAMATADGTVYAVTSDAIYRGGTDGAFTRLAECVDCGGWMHELSDGTILFSSGVLFTDGRLVRRAKSEERRSVLGPDDRAWFGGGTSSLWSMGVDGERRQIPVERPHSTLGIGATRDEIVFGMPGEIRRIRPDVHRPIEFQDGDVLAYEIDPWGISPRFVHHRPGTERFVRLPLEDAYDFRKIGDPIFAASPSRVLMWWPSGNKHVIGMVNRAGVPQPEIAVEGVSRSVDAFVLDRDDTMYAVSSSWSPRETRFLTIDANGVLRKELVVPGLGPVWKVDLATDQCTLLYGTLDGIGRMNVCTGTMLPPFVNAKEPSDLR
ncbi:MAG TPA: hypothetical protein VF787_29390, partial [Thermoanaerobaculia bacterium]